MSRVVTASLGGEPTRNTAGGATTRPPNEQAATPSGSPAHRMQVLSATTSPLNLALGIATIAVALLAAVLTATSYYYNASQTWKQNRLKQGLAAYKAALAWQTLYDAAAHGELTGAGDTLAARVRKVSTETAYHLVSLWGEAEAFGETYNAYLEALREVYENPLLTALNTSETSDWPGLPTITKEELDKVNDARIAFLVKVNWLASAARPLHALSAAVRTKEASEKTPEWLTAADPGRVPLIAPPKPPRI